MFLSLASVSAVHPSPSSGDPPMGAPPEATLASVSGHHPKRQAQRPAFPSPSCPTDEKQRATHFLFFL